jgi:hypothetical protein
MVIMLFWRYAIEVKEVKRMAEIIRVGDLEIDQDLDFQQRSWMVQGIGWVVMPLIVLAALLGLLGSGPLSSATAGSEAGPLWLEYDRFGHHQGPMTLRFHLGAKAVSEGMARLWLSQDYVEKIQIEQVTPEPERVEMSSGGLTYIFPVTEPNQEMIVTFYLKPDKFGPLTGQVGLVEGQSLHFNQFIYP